jgi:hypothetical protein
MAMDKVELSINNLNCFRQPSPQHLTGWLPLFKNHRKMVPYTFVTLEPAQNPRIHPCCLEIQNPILRPTIRPTIRGA